MQGKNVYGIIAIVVVAVILTAACVHVIENPSQKDSGRIGIIGAMDEEVASLKETMKKDHTETVSGMEFFFGKIGDCDIVVVQCGMGKVNAGICAQTLITKFNVKAIINTGVAGSLDNSLEIGDFVVSVDAVQHDFDVSPIGFERGEVPYTGKYSFEADKDLREKFVDAIHKCCPDVVVHEGRICSGDQFISSHAQKDEITSKYGGLCCEMEGGAVALVCYLNDVPFVIVGAVSDKADGSAEMDYEEFKRKAAERSTEAIIYLLEHTTL